MSFGYSVGDFIGGANLTYQLIRVLKDSRGASIEYQEAMLELSAMQQAFLQVSQLSRNPVIPKATVNSATHIVMSAMDIIANFLERSHEYQKRLGGSSGSSRLGNQPAGLDIGDSWAKIGWALYKKDELKTLRDSLHSRLSSVSLLLSAAAHCNPLPETMTKYQLRPTEDEVDMMRQFAGHEQPPSKTLEPPSHISANNFKKEEAEPANNIPRSYEEPDILDKITVPSQAPTFERVSRDDDSQKSECTLKSSQHSNSSPPLPPDSLADVHVEHVPTENAGNSDPRAEHIEDMQQLSDDWISGLTRQNVHPFIVEEFRSMLFKGIKAIGQQIRPIKFKDAVGRKFSFPYHLVKTWEGMEELIKQAFLQVDVLGPHVEQGHYDLIGPNGEVILPSVWGKVVFPDMQVNMTMWPIDKSPAVAAPSRKKQFGFTQPQRTMTSVSHKFIVWKNRKGVKKREDSSVGAAV